MDLSNRTIEELFQRQMMALTKDTARRMRSLDRQFSVGVR